MVCMSVFHMCLWVRVTHLVSNNMSRLVPNLTLQKIICRDLTHDATVCVCCLWATSLPLLCVCVCVVGFTVWLYDCEKQSLAYFTEELNDSTAIRHFTTNVLFVCLFFLPVVFCCFVFIFNQFCDY